MQIHGCRAQDAGDIERAISAFTRSANGGLIVVPNNTTIVHRKLIIALAAKLHLPAVYRLPSVCHGRRSDLLRT